MIYEHRGTFNIDNSLHLVPKKVMWLEYIYVWDCGLGKWVCVHTMLAQ